MRNGNTGTARTLWSIAIAVVSAFSIGIASATPVDDARQTFEQFVAAQNEHNAERVKTLLLDTPDFLWVSRGIQIHGVQDAMETYKNTMPLRGILIPTWIDSRLFS